MPAVNPGIVPKASAKAMDPEQLSELTGAGNVPAGLTIGGRQGASAFPPPLGTNNRIMGIAGAKVTGTQTADAAASATGFPSQFVFPATKYRNPAFGLGMTAGVAGT